MADDGKTQTGNTWPLVKFAFSVKIGDTEAIFQEVTGLGEEQQIEYRGGNNTVWSTVKMPGIKKYGNVTLKKGIFKDDKALWDMYNQLKMNALKPQTITISLLDEVSAVAMSWTLTNAFPTKMTGTDMKSDANEAAVESIEIAHEGLAVAH